MWLVFYLLLLFNAGYDWYAWEPVFVGALSALRSALVGQRENVTHDSDMT